MGSGASGPSRRRHFYFTEGRLHRSKSKIFGMSSLDETCSVRSTVGEMLLFSSVWPTAATLGQRGQGSAVLLGWIVLGKTLSLVQRLGMIGSIIVSPNPPTAQH